MDAGEPELRTLAMLILAAYVFLLRIPSEGIPLVISARQCGAEAVASLQSPQGSGGVVLGTQEESSLPVKYPQALLVQVLHGDMPSSCTGCIHGLFAARGAALRPTVTG